jgi:hypothetical protein
MSRQELVTTSISYSRPERSNWCCGRFGKNLTKKKKKKKSIPLITSDLERTSTFFLSNSSPLGHDRRRVDSEAARV